MGVAGWNTSAACSNVPAADGGGRELGTLLGPEETPVVGFSWCRFWPGRLTRGFLLVGFLRGGGCGLGCGCVLSVA